MNSPRIDPSFRNGLRRQLLEQAARPEPRHPARLFAIGGLTLSLLAIGGAAVAAGILGLPGGETRTEVGSSITLEGVGDGELQLGPAPASATQLRIELQCLTAGTFEFPARGGSLHCNDQDARDPERSAGFIFVPLDEAGDSLAVSAGDGAQWQLLVSYIDAQPIPLAVNDNGDTYGIMDAPEGTPDLVSVYATNGQLGYVYVDELAEADGTAAVETFRTPQDALDWQAAREGQRFAIPVYRSDGETVIGEFVIQ